MKMRLLTLMLAMCCCSGGCAVGVFAWEPRSFVHTAVLHENADALRREVRAHPDEVNSWSWYKPDDENIGYVTPMSLAAYIDWPEGIDILAACGGEVNPPIAAEDTHSHRPPLSRAMDSRSSKAAKRLLELGADPYWRRVKGDETIIDRVARAQNPEMLQVFGELIPKRQTP